MELTHARCVVYGLFVACAGCFGGGVSKLPEVFPVQGLITYDGQPVEGAIVIFSPTDKKGRTAAARTDALGEYRLRTFQDGDGCVPGRMSVTVSKSESPTEPDPKTGKIPPMKNHLPLRYSDSSTSGLEANVEAKKDNKFDFRLDK